MEGENSANELDQQLRQEFLKIGKKAKYGTAGFRDLAKNMPFIAFRVGAFVCTLNKTAPSFCLGVVMSASHNKIEDNGVKITNFSGNMLEMHYQQILEKFMAQETLQEAIEMLKKYLTEERKMNIFTDQTQIFIGGDTRPSTSPLLELVQKGIKSQGGLALNFGLTTTPQLQYYVYLYNRVIKPKNHESTQIQIEKLRPLYWNNFTKYFIKSVNYIGWAESKDVKTRSIDCANGVGGVAMPHFIPLLDKYLQIQLFNDKDNDHLNSGCGADYVKTEQKFPRTYQAEQQNSFVSFDGDADRIVEYIEEQGKLKLIDGDRQGTVFTQFFKQITDQLASRTEKINNMGVMHLTIPTKPSIGFVQTYYANYSSSEYLKKQYEMQPVYAATGVKYLHQKAEHYDIGVYFEANGHGTVIFNSQFINKLQAVLENRDMLFATEMVKNNEEFKKQLAEFYSFLQFYLNSCYLANPSVGDAITNLLLFQLALRYMNKSYKDTLSLYADLKSKTSKISVKNKQALKVTDIEDKVVSPQKLQAQIEEIIGKHKGKKAFLRASGTENVLRLHVEAESLQQVQAMTKQITNLVATHPILN